MAGNIDYHWQHARRQLHAARFATADLDARFLLCAACNLSFDDVLQHKHTPMQHNAIEKYDNYINQRLAGISVARIIGHKEFWGLNFTLSPDTLEPRPDSETLIDCVIKNRPDAAAEYHILDMGTGSGCLLLSLLHIYKNATGMGTDINKGALTTAQHNAEQLGMTTRAEFIQSDWGQNIRNQKFDIIICNPPYIAQGDSHVNDEAQQNDPAQALYAGTDGLDCYRQIIPALPALLRPRGMAVLELGHTQYDAVTQMAAAAQLALIEKCHDLGGHIRCIALK